MGCRVGSGVRCGELLSAAQHLVHAPEKGGRRDHAAGNSAGMQQGFRPAGCGSPHRAGLHCSLQVHLTHGHVHSGYVPMCILPTPPCNCGLYIYLFMYTVCECVQHTPRVLFKPTNFVVVDHGELLIDGEGEQLVCAPAPLWVCSCVARVCAVEADRAAGGRLLNARSKIAQIQNPEPE